MEEQASYVVAPVDFASGQQAPPTRAFILADTNNNRIPPRDSLVRLVEGYALALLTKLEKARSKYGYEEDGWMEEGWQQHCASELLRHVDKGDPLDVGAYTAFQWFHKWSTTPTPAIHEVVSRCATAEAQLAAAETAAAELLARATKAEAKAVDVVRELLGEWRDSTAPADVAPPAAHHAWDGWQREQSRKQINHRAFFDMKCVQLTGLRLEPGGIYEGIPAPPASAPVAPVAGVAAGEGGERS